MPREKENFREQYMVISEAFNGKPLLNVSEVARWLRMDRHAVAKRFKFKDGRISAVQLASDMLPLKKPPPPKRHKRERHTKSRKDLLKL